MKKTVLKRVGVLSLAKTLAGLYSGVCIVFVAFVVAFSFFFFFLSAVFTAIVGGDNVVTTLLATTVVSAGIMLLWAVVAIVFYTIIGFIFGAVGALVYNFIAKHLGGVEFEFEKQ